MRPMPSASTRKSRARCRDLLRELGGALALVTGRSITSADLLFPGLKLADGRPARLRTARRRRAPSTCMRRCKETQAKLRKLLRALAKRHPQLLIEDKGAAHGAALSKHAAARLACPSHACAVDRRGDGYELQPGKMLLEVRPEGRDKGAAIDDFMAEEPFAGRVPVFVGDDLTDEHGFAAVERLGGWTIKVGVGRTMPATGCRMSAPYQAG